MKPTLTCLSLALVAAGAVIAEGATEITVDNPSSEGGRVRICNSAKTGATTSDWSIWNMTNGYGNGLSFWRYYANGTNAGPAMWLGDNGKVGIGTVIPAEKLDIAGNVLISNGETASIFPSGHNLFFGGRQDYAHVIYTFRPSWGTPTDTWATLAVQRADTAGNFTTTAQIASNGFSFLNGGNVGIGTANPQNKLTIVESINPIVDAFSGVPTLVISGRSVNSRSDAAVQQVLYLHQPNNGNGGYSKGSGFGIGLSFWEDPGNNYPRTRVDFKTTGRTTDTVEAGNAVMSLRDDGNVGIGTTSPSHKLTVNGTIRAKEVIVDTGWADYVFAEDYRLAPLSEVEAHIKTHKHLPDMPSAAEVAEQGVSMGEMQARMMAKMEEMMLHIIAQGKELSQVKSENAVLKARVAELEEVLK